MILKTFILEKYYFSCSNLAQSTINGYKSSINKYILPTFGDLELEEITVEKIQNWLLNSFPNKPGAAEKAYKTLRQILRKAKDYDLLINDPTEYHITLPKKQNYQPKILNAEEINILLKGFENHYLEPTLYCAVLCGLRRGEAIDLKNGKVLINKSYQKVNGQILILPTKTTKSTRVCYLPKFAVKRLKKIKSLKGPICIEPDPDKRIKDYKNFCLKNTLPYTSFTNLRHSWATLALESGIDIAIIANMLGHTEISTAYNHYLKPREQTYLKTQNYIFKYSFLNQVKQKIKIILSYIHKRK